MENLTLSPCIEISFDYVSNSSCFVVCVNHTFQNICFITTLKSQKELKRAQKSQKDFFFKWDNNKCMSIEWSNDQRCKKENVYSMTFWGVVMGVLGVLGASVWGYMWFWAGNASIFFCSTWKPLSNCDFSSTVVDVVCSLVYKDHDNDGATIGKSGPARTCSLAE